MSVQADGGNLLYATLQGVASAWLTADHRPRMILKTDGTAVWINAGAERLLDECHGITAVGGIIRLTDHEQDARFHSFLRDLTFETRTMAVKFEGEESFCVFRGRHLPNSAVCCVDVRFSSSRYRPKLLDFDHVFGLTASESRTATALYGGQTAQEVADERHISVDTVRSHIRQLYSKIGVSGREQLFRQLDAFRID